MYSLVALFYLGDVVESINKACGVVFIIMIAVLFISTIAFLVIGDTDGLDGIRERIEPIKKAIKWYIIIGVVNTLILIFTPSQRTVYLSAGTIIAGQTVDKVLNSELYQKLYKVVNEKLDNMITYDEK